MPDLQNFLVSRNGTATLNNAPRWNISFQICHSKTGVVLRDFTGQNSFTFPQILGTFSAADQDELVERWTMDLIRKRAPDLF